MTDSTAKVRARYDYDPYGVRTSLTSGILAADWLDCDFGFTGHYYHAGSNLHLTLYRAYDQDTGRWLSADPIGETGGMNLYAYVGGNPMNGVDPLGLWEWRDIMHISPIYNLGYIAALFHFNREIYNSPVPNSPSTQMKPEQSVYHTQGTRCGKSNIDNTKHILPDGRETVYDRNGNIVTDPVNMGTYNYWSMNHWYDFPGHFVLDMLPYYWDGNTPEDPTTMWQRLSRGFGGDGYAGDTGRFYSGGCP